MYSSTHKHHVTKLKYVSFKDFKSGLSAKTFPVLPSIGRF